MPCFIAAGASAAVAGVADKSGLQALFPVHRLTTSFLACSFKFAVAAGFQVVVVMVNVERKNVLVLARFFTF